MASSTEAPRRAALVLAFLATGCLSGHLLDAARRREVPTAVAAVSLDHADLVVTVRTATVTDLDRPVGEGVARARIALADVARAVPVESLRVRWQPAIDPAGGRPLLVLADDTVTAPPPVARLARTGPPALLLRTDARPYPPLYLEALVRRRYAPWVWAVMPAAVVADAIIVPPLLLFAPAVITVGD